MIQLIETYCKAKKEESQNEDGLFLSDRFIAVVDGATSKNAKLHNGKTGGQIIKDIILDALNELVGEESYYEAVCKIQARIEADFPEDKFFHATASAVIYSVMKKELWFVGDCQAMINGSIYDNKKEVDQVASKARSIAISAYLESGMSEADIQNNDLGRELILPLLKLQAHLENNDSRYGYLVFNNSGMPDAVLKSKGLTVAVPSGSEVILASDGYPILKNTLAESESVLNQLLVEDPLCYKENMTTKGLGEDGNSFDDRTFVRFTS